MYNVREITKDVWWVGGHDHRLTLFENMHPIPLGVSYNAYLLFDKKSTILFDTAEWTSCPQLMENISYLLEKYGRDKVDYLVVNHMECDHSSSVTTVLDKWAPTIISTEKGFMLMRQFAYNPDDYKTETVKEGDTRTFEDHTIAFVEAPMVHWPEVMITLDVTNGVLFSADAFGSFIALDGKLFAKEVNYPRDWMDEARRYLTNIVGKYGPEVMHLVGKVLKLDLLPKIKYICSLHGLVWEADNFPYILDKYLHWATYTPEEKGVLLVYGSIYGNTESAAFALASKIVEKSITNVSVYDASSTHVSYLISEAFKFSHIVICSPTYNLNIFPPIHEFLDHMRLLNLQNRKIAIVENGSWAVRSGDLIQEFIEKNMDDMEIINERITIASTMSPDKGYELDSMAQAIADSMNATDISLPEGVPQLDVSGIHFARERR